MTSRDPHSSSEIHLSDVARTAWQRDDIALMAHAISICPKDSLELFCQRNCEDAISKNATAVLELLIEKGVRVQNLRTDVVASGKPTTAAILEILLSHGWDINARQDHLGDAVPFMWYCVKDYDAVLWCLEHGASVMPRGVDPLMTDRITQIQRRCSPILERVATRGSVATFELLRSMGAPLGWQPLHLAIQTAAYSCVSEMHGLPGPSKKQESSENREKQAEMEQVDEKRQAKMEQVDVKGQADMEQMDEEKRAQHAKCTKHFADRMAMIRHLVDVVGVDVNARDQPPGRMIAGHVGPPLSYIAAACGYYTDTRELTWFLLDRGSDPAPALVEAGIWNKEFVQEVEEWMARRRKGEKGRAWCRVQ